MSAEGGTARERSREHLIFADLVARLYANSTVPLWGSLVAGVLVAAAHWTALPKAVLVGWAALILVPTILRLRLNARYRAEAPGPADAPLWARRSALVTLLAGLLWGCAGMLVTLDQNMVALVVTVTTIQALIMGGVVSLSPYIPSFFAFALPAALPMIIALVLRGEPGHVVLAGCNLLFLALLSAVTLANNRALRSLLDLTHEKQALIQDLTRARLAAEDADRAKSSFLAVMSHELRTPITGLLGMADLLAGTGLDGEQRRWVGMMRGSARTLLTVLNDILDFTKMEAGKLAIEEAPYDPRRLVAEVLDLYRPRAADRNLTLAADLDGIGGAALTGDPVRIRQVLSNLLDNAVKFTERGGITVTAWTEIAADGDLRLHMHVADTGIGMTEEEMAGLFRPFTQADRTTTRRFGGTGLGLAICRRLLEAMGGAIAVDSRPGFGSVFRFHVRTAPVMDTDAEVAAVPPPPMDTPKTPPVTGAPTPGGARILLAEDNATNRELIIAMLGRLGFSITAVENGALAVQAVRAGGYDLVIMDIQMPVMDGITACRAIRALDGPEGGIPVIALSADLMAERRRAGQAAGMDAYLGKPVDWSRLVHTMRRLIAERPMPGGVATAAEAEAEAAGNTPQPEPVSGKSTDGTGDLPVLNAERMADLALTLGPELSNDLLREMLASARSELAQARAALTAADGDRLRLHAHTLKGLAANFGADRLAEAARLLNRLDGLDGAQAALETVAVEIDATGEAVTAGIPGPALADQDC